jgi:hypothetical protein
VQIICKISLHFNYMLKQIGYGMLNLRNGIVLGKLAVYKLFLLNSMRTKHAQPTNERTTSTNKGKGP